jgi:hypothetical protein
MNYRICKKCGISKEESRKNFYPVKSDSDKYRTTCKECSQKGKKRNYPEDILKRYSIDEVGCWIYTGAKSHLGYGIFYMQQHSYPAHRVSYELAKGKIEKGLVIDHSCRKRSCINPDHLEAVTQSENVRRTWLPPHCATCSCKGEK